MILHPPVVSLLSPPGPPGVLDGPVGQVGVEERVLAGAVAHDEHPVVEAVRRAVAQELPGVAHLSRGRKNIRLG